MIGNTSHIRLGNGMPAHKNHEAGLGQQGLLTTQAETTGLGGLGAPKNHGGPKGDLIVPEATDGEWTCYNCKVKNEDGRILCKNCGKRG